MSSCIKSLIWKEKEIRMISFEFENPLLPQYLELQNNQDARKQWHAHLICKFLIEQDGKIDPDCNQLRHVSFNSIKNYSLDELYKVSNPFVQTLIAPFETKFATYKALKRKTFF